jgi:CBS domain-containing protein
MQAKELMTREPRAVRLHERLDAAARVMWEQDCGFCPVVDSTGVLVGVLTDRDLCMAAYTQGRSLSELGVTAAMARSVRTVRAEDTVQAVLAVMQQAQVHRVPVVDARGMLVGIVASNDLVRAAVNRPAAVDALGVVKALAVIGSPRDLAVPGATRPASVASDARSEVTRSPAIAPRTVANAAVATAAADTRVSTPSLAAPTGMAAVSVASKGRKPAAKPKPKAKAMATPKPKTKSRKG